MERKDYDKRPHYFPGQYLLEDDFELEQNYHVDRQRRHNRLLHVSGIADGLIVQPESNLTVKISPGTAIDSNGRQIVWSDDMANAPVNLQAYNKEIANGNYILSIGYDEKLTDLQDVTDGNTRWYEKPNFNLVPDSQSIPDDFIALAKLKIDGTTVTLDESDKNVRQYSGLRLPSPDKINPPALRSGGDGASNLAVLSGSLSVTGNVGIGTTNPTAKLEVSGNISATNATLSGNIVIGTGTNAPLKKVQIESGELRVKASHNNETADIGAFYANNLTQGIGIGYNRIEAIGRNANQDILIRPKGSGNVGIGTTNPPNQAKLVVQGDLAVLSANVIRFFNSVNDAHTQIGSGAQGAGFSNFWIRSADASQYGYLFNPANGNVGIGTTEPTTKLEISGGSLKVSENISAGGNLSVTGNIGIGTTTTNAKLEVKLAGATTDASLKLEHNGSNFIVRPFSAEGTSSVIENTGGGSLLINPSGGNVGIGTKSEPVARLHIDPNRPNGGGIAIGNPNLYSSENYTLLYLTISADKNGYGQIQALKSGGSSFGNLILNQQGGNVGIGTTSPAATLEVAGKISATECFSLNSRPALVEGGNIQGGDGYRGIYSPNQKYKLTVQNDGSIVLFFNTDQGAVMQWIITRAGKLN